MSPVSHRSTVAALLLLTFATGLIDAISVLVLGHVFVANMTGNVIFLGFWFVPHSGVDLTAAVSTVVVSSGMPNRRAATFTGVLTYHGAGRLVLISGLAAVFGAQQGNNFRAECHGDPDAHLVVEVAGEPAAGHRAEHETDERHHRPVSAKSCATAWFSRCAGERWSGRRCRGSSSHR